MNDVAFILIAGAIIVVGLVFMVVSSSASFNTWFGDSGFLKVPKTFNINVFGFFDFLNGVYAFFFLFFIVSLIKSNFKIYDFGFVMVLLPVIIFAFLPIFHFYKKYIFYKLNGNLDYTFDSNDKTLHINDSDATTFSEKDIAKIKLYCIGGKIDFLFNIIQLKNGKEIVISSDLPFHGHLFDFFGKNIPFEHIDFSPFDLFKYLKLLRNLI